MSLTAASDPANLYWAKLAEYLRHACALFGLPAALARKLWISRAEHKRVTSFLRVLEDILRRLIFIDAMALTPAPAPAPAPAEAKRRAPRGMPAAFGAPFDMENSETWRVSFKLHAAADRRLPAGNAIGVRQAVCRQDAGGPSERISSAPSAQRLEALIRAYNNRERLAQCLARKLAREARAALNFLTPPLKRVARKPGGLTLVDVSARASQAHQAFLARVLNSS